MTDTATGRCQCGKIRYRVKLDDTDAYFCHCRMCQRASGGVALPFKNTPKANVEWTTREPDYYESSPIARRGYCKDCGTPLTFDHPDHDRMDVTIGSFDDPSIFEPKRHFGVEGLHEQWLNTADLPRLRTDQNESIVKRWEEKTGKIPD
jgi:hypothetical protein